jgi:hypothetical protein
MKEITRYINRTTERELWARAAGRCQFNGCNQLLYKSPVTQERLNISEKAHIYSISQDGPRGWGLFKSNKKAINDITNLLLVCHACHKTIDQSIDGERYSADLLIGWKELHERRIEIVTGIIPDKKSHVVFYGAKIGIDDTPLQPIAAIEAMFPTKYPVSERPINLSMYSSNEDDTDDYWKTEHDHILRFFDKYINPLIREEPNSHFSLFALAPQPLLILLGTLFTDKAPVDVYQLHREPQTWKWQNYTDNFSYIINRPQTTNNDPALVISLSDKIRYDRVTQVLNDKIDVWELTIENCNNDFLKSQSQLSMFRESIRKLMVAIKAKHGHIRPLHIFPAMPMACAVEMGRVRMPKAEMPWIVYDQNNNRNGFIKTISIGEMR